MYLNYQEHLKMIKELTERISQIHILIENSKPKVVSKIPSWMRKP